MKPKKLIDHLRRKHRVRSRIFGTATRPRLNVFRGNQSITAQLIDDENSKTLTAAHDLKLKKGTKTERAQTVGKQLAENALQMKIGTCVFDRNGYKYHGRVKALANAAREAGLKF